MPIKNMQELNNVLKKELRKAMTITAKKILADMYEEVGNFYSGGEPIPAENGGYVRTGALGDTPTTTSLSEDSETISFNAYLDLKHKYTTGKNPNMINVLLLTNDIMTKQDKIGYLRKAKGSPHYWDKALSKMENTYFDVLGKFFDKI